MSSKFGQMRPLVSMATDWVTVGKQCHRIFSMFFDRIHFILAGNDDIHKSLNEFEIRRDPTMDYGVGCPLASEKIPQTYNGENDVITFSPLFFI